MFSRRSRLTWPLLALAGCADPLGAYEDFAARRGGLDGGQSGGAGGPCLPPAPGQVSGTALMAIGTSFSENHPILFYGRLETPQVDGKTAVVFHYHPLDAADRMTELGDELVLGPYVIGGDGSFEASPGEMTLPGAANAVLPGVPITSTLIFHGTICGVRRFYCGTVSGSSRYPVEGPVEGDFGIELLQGGIPAQPRYGCAADQLAVPLP